MPPNPGARRQPDPKPHATTIRSRKSETTQKKHFKAQLDGGRGSISNKTVQTSTDDQPSIPQAGAGQEARQLSLPRTENGIVVVLSSGDILLEICASEGSEVLTYRVNMARLVKDSSYFERLFQSPDFAEGSAIRTQQSYLKDQFTSPTDVPSDQLPRVKITDVGMISSSVKNIGPLMTDFLLLLHGLEPTRKIPPSSLANLAVVADRFDCTAVIAAWARSKGLLRPSSTGQGSSQAPLSEEAHRQRILVGMLLDQPQWVLFHSMQLVLSGSIRWTSADANLSFAALWWELPRGVEDELQYRRSCVLSTIADLQRHLLELYISRTRQCRLGYDSSPQCDSFQLGEFVKFLARAGTLQLGSSLADAEQTDDTARDIRTLLTTLRACPSYQLDANHSHCGARKPFLAGLSMIDQCLHEGCIGLCLECRRSGLPDSWSWMHMKKPVSVDAAKVSGADSAQAYRQVCAHGNSSRGRDLFIANERLWII